MGARPSRVRTDRDLRSMSTEELLSLLAQDARDLDRAWRERHRAVAEAPYRAPEQPAAPPKKSQGRRVKRDAPAPVQGAQVQGDLFEPEPEHATFHAVTCCDAHLGDFPAIARVRCQFCETWHKAGDFPVRVSDPD